MMLTYAGIGCLGIGAVFDVRTRQIPNWLFALFLAGAVLFRLVTGQLFRLTVLAGIGIGAVVLLAAKKMPRQLGEGDGWMVLVLGVCEGGWACMESLLAGMLLAAAAAILLLLTRRGSLKTTLPFVPFLFAGYLLWCACGGICS